MQRGGGGKYDDENDRVDSVFLIGYDSLFQADKLASHLNRLDSDKSFEIETV